MLHDWRKTFVTIYIGQAFSILGSAAVQFSIIWWLTMQTESAITLTTASIVGFLPNIFIGPFAGVWVDRYNRRTVMILADGLVALSSAVLGAAFLAGTPSIGFIYIILFLRGLGSTFHSPAMQAAIPLLVPGDMLSKAGGWGNMISSLSSMLGPVLGAALMAFMPIAAVMLVDILGAAFAIVCLLLIKIPDIPRQKEQQETRRFSSDFKEGIAALRSNRPLMSIFIPMVFVNILYMPLGSLFPLLIRTHFVGTAWDTSIAEFTFAAGMLISSFIMGIWGGMKKRFLMVSLAVVMLGVLSFVGGILPPTAFFVFAGGCFFMGATGTFTNVPLMAHIQETTSPEVLGKVLSIIMTAMSLAMPAGLVIAGPVSETIGVARWFVYSGLAIIVVGFVTWLVSKKYDVPAKQDIPARQTAD